MDAEEVSSVLVELDGGEFGIVTDRDLRSRVVAGRLSPDDPVNAAMSAPVVGVGARPDRSGRDADHARPRHPPRPGLLAGRDALGVIVAIDLVAAETSSPFVLRRAIARARNKDELREAAGRLRSTVVTLHRAELTPFHISDVVSAVSDALIRRMIELAIETAGPPPAEFAWMALGSHGRREPDAVLGRRLRAWPGGTGRIRIRSGRAAPPTGIVPHDRLHAGDRRERGRLHPGARLATGPARRHRLRRLLRQLDRGLADEHRELARRARPTTGS